MDIYTSITAILTLAVVAGGITYFLTRHYSPLANVLPNFVLQTINEAVIAVNPDLKIEFINQGALQLFNLPESQLIGASFEQLFTTPELFAKIHQSLESNSLDPNLLSNEEAQIKTASGRIVPISVSVTKVADITKHHVGFIFVLTDISKAKEYTHSLEEKVSLIQKNNWALETLKNELEQEKRSIELRVRERTTELRAEHARLQASIFSLSMGFIMIDSTFKIQTINSSARRIFNIPDKYYYEHQMVTGLVDEGLINTLEQRLSHVLSLKQTIEKCLSTSMLDIKEISYEYKYYRLFFNPIVVRSDDHIDTIGAVILIEDITEAKVLDRSKEEFFSIASHELRTPLTAIKGFIYLIKQHYAQQLTDPKLRQMLDRIDESGSRLIKMVNDFLDTSRLEQSRLVLKKETIDIVALVQDVVSEYQNLAQSKGLSLQFQQLDKTIPGVVGDITRTQQVLVNLIGNAIKFTDRGGITVTIEQVNEKEVKIKVRDTGRGISDTNQGLLFHKFQQANDNIYIRESTGTGLGLYISKLLIERMGGQISLESSTLGQGSTFSFTLPIVTHL